LKIVEIQIAPHVHGGGRGDDTRTWSKACTQQGGQDEIRHVIGRESEFQPVLRERTAMGHHAGVIDHYVDLRLDTGNLAGYPLHLRDDRQIGVMDTVICVRLDRAQACERSLSPGPLTCRKNDASSARSESLGGNGAYARGRAGNDDGWRAQNRLTQFRKRTDLR